MTSPENQTNPRTAPPEVRRKQLIDATITCIAKVGISSTTLTAIAKEAGLSLGLVNFHFVSKDLLLSETLTYLAGEHREMWMREVRRNDLSVEEKLRSVVTAQFHRSICSRKKLAVWFAFFGEATHRRTYRAITSQIDMERQEYCAELFADIIADGAYSGIDAEETSLTLESMFDGLWLNMLLYPGKFTREKAVCQVLDYLDAIFPGRFQRARGRQGGTA